MSVADRKPSRVAIRAAAQRLGRQPTARDQPAPEPPPGTPPHLRKLPWIVFGSGEVVHIAATFRTRLRGLLGTRELPTHHALLLTKTRSVHMLGMTFALDLVWLSADGRVVRVDSEVQPREQRRCANARAVLEVPCGEGERFAALVQTSGVAMMTGH